MQYTNTMEYYTAIRNDDIIQFTAVWMKSEDNLKYKVSQKKDKVRMISLICGI